MKRILILVIFLCRLAFSQNTPTIGMLPDSGPNLPATCVVGQLYFKTTTTTGLNQCATANTWTAFSSGGGSGTVTSVGLVGTANQITVTGASPITASGSWTLSIPSSAALPGSPTTTTQSQNDNSTKISTTAYTDLAVANAVAGVNPAIAVLAASTSSQTGTYNNGVSGIGATFTITATGAYTLDGVSISTIGQRVLLKNQSSAFQNGVYTATVVGTVAVSPVFTRALDYDTPSDINSTGAIPVQSGTANVSTSWLLTSTVVTMGTDALTYTQFSVNPSSLPSLIASGTSAMGTGAISSGTCATVVTTTATGTATTDTIIVTPNADPTGVTGYAVSATGSLYIQGYPTSGNVNFKVCNNTSGSLTPSALTLNWKVIR